MIVGYEMFRNLTMAKHIRKQEQREKLQEFLINPGVTLVLSRHG